MAQQNLHVFTLICLMFGVLVRWTIAAPSRKNMACGRYQEIGANREAKIVGGVTASAGEFPWMVSFKAKHGHFCSGTVISDSYVMSAAHCFHKNEYLVYDNGSVNLRSLNVTVGEYSLKNANERTEMVMNLARIHLHPNYDPVSKQNDIAIIKLAKSIGAVPDVVPVCLPGKSDDSLWEKNKRATVVGWGKTSYTQDYFDWVHETDALKKVTVKIWDRDACVDKYKTFPKFPSTSFLCAGDHGKESCTGDSGGPLLRLNEDNKWVAIGIVANGNKCGQEGRPGVYTLVSDFMQWIESCTR